MSTQPDPLDAATAAAMHYMLAARAGAELARALDALELLACDGTPAAVGLARIGEDLRREVEDLAARYRSAALLAESQERAAQGFRSRER